MKIQLHRLPRSEYPVEPGLYFWQWATWIDFAPVEYKFGIGYCFDGYYFDLLDLPSGIAWSERIECEVIG